MVRRTPSANGSTARSPRHFMIGFRRPAMKHFVHRRTLLFNRAFYDIEIAQPQKGCYLRFSATSG
jgi:hypothetical protein